MEKTKIVIVDADIIVARVNSTDFHHKRVVELEKKMLESNINLFYPRTTIIEAITVIQRLSGSKKSADEMAERFVKSRNVVVEIDAEIYKRAVRLFKQTGNKKDTLFDCIVASIAKKKKTDTIFSFDKFYKRLGFRLAGEIW